MDQRLRHTCRAEKRRAGRAEDRRQSVKHHNTGASHSVRVGQGASGPPQRLARSFQLLLLSLHSESWRECAQLERRRERKIWLEYIRLARKMFPDGDAANTNGQRRHSGEKIDQHRNSWNRVTIRGISLDAQRAQRRGEPQVR